MAVPFSWMISGTHLLLSNCIPMRPDQRAMVLSLALSGSSALLQISGNPSILPFSNYFLFRGTQRQFSEKYLFGRRFEI